MGAILRVKVHYTSLALYLQSTAGSDILNLYGTSLTGTDLYTVRLKSPSLLLLGNEANGVSPDLSRLMHENIFIPNFSTSHSRSESLNVSMAAGIFCSEFRRQNA